MCHHRPHTGDNRCSWSFLECRAYSLAVLLHCLSRAPRNIDFFYTQQVKYLHQNWFPFGLQDEEYSQEAASMKFSFGWTCTVPSWGRCLWEDKAIQNNPSAGGARKTALLCVKALQLPQFCKTLCLLIWACLMTQYRRTDTVNLLWFASPEVMLSLSGYRTVARNPNLVLCATLRPGTVCQRQISASLASPCLLEEGMYK